MSSAHIKRGKIEVDDGKQDWHLAFFKLFDKNRIFGIFSEELKNTFYVLFLKILNNILISVKFCNLKFEDYAFLHSVYFQILRLFFSDLASWLKLILRFIT
jgi:hypothetical protein